MTFKLETPEHQRTAIRSVVETLLYPSFGAPLVFLWSPYGESGLSRRCDGDPEEVYALGNIGGVAKEAGFNGLRTYVHLGR